MILALLRVRGFVFEGYGDHRDLHVLTHSFPTRRSSDLAVHHAKDEGLPAIVATFDPHPVRFFKPGVPPFRLTTLDQRQALFAKARSEEHTSELQSLMRISYAVFCLKKKNKRTS